MESLTSFEYIGITSFGRNYLHPKLVVIDGFTKKVLPEIDIVYEIGDPRVTDFQQHYWNVQRSTKNCSSENTNGVGISSLTFDNIEDCKTLFGSTVLNN